MTLTVFAELRFWLLVAFSVVLPFFLYGLLLKKRAVSRNTVLVLGFVFVLIAGLDVYLLNVIRPTRIIAPVMVKQKAGAIVNISTAWAFEPEVHTAELWATPPPELAPP